MREIVSSGALGRPLQINNWEYKPWLSQPRLGTEVEGEIGGGVLYRQGPHQTDIVRGIGGGLVRSVRAVAGRWHPAFPDAEGDYTAFLEFQDGTAATMVFNGYGYFDVTELTWGIGEGGQEQDPLRPKRPRATGAVDTEAKYAYADARAEAEQAHRGNRRRQPFYGLTLVSCERGDLRQSPDGLYVYTEDGREEVTFERKHGRGELEELVEAVRGDRPSFPDAHWGMATLEVILAVRQSSHEHQEISLIHQVPCPF
jgi:phthalate 4,5-cis-dihydrodiol dehydrogenase